MDCALFLQGDVYKKLKLIDSTCQQAIENKIVSFNDQPHRNIVIAPPESHPTKRGLNSNTGQARLLHDLANIELQAMELGVRTLIDFPEAPDNFRQQIIGIIKDEAHHLRLCLDAIEHLGYKWGDWPIHNNLWNATSSKDSLLERILIVHRFLEGSGLDASEKIILRLSTIKSPIVYKALNTIVKEEVSHVEFGSQWFQQICKAQSKDPEEEFKQLLDSLFSRLPVRLERISTRLRKQAGFTDNELNTLLQFQDKQRARRN